MSGTPTDPWKHRYVAANGARFHLVEVTGTVSSTERVASDRSAAPLVLFLHGFPQAWWTWRNQLPSLASAGFTVAAMDLRGYGESDKPPRGYDLPTLAADVAGVIGALGRRDAVVVGHGWGGLVAWTLATLHAHRVAAVAVVSAPHPRSVLRDPRALRKPALAHALAMQLPWLPERRIRSEAYLAQHLTAWSAPASSFPTDADVRRSLDALADWPAPHCAVEYHRWLGRSFWRRDGRAYAARMRGRVRGPVLLIQGADDPTLGAAGMRRAVSRVDGTCSRQVIADAGHFPQEEQPDRVTEALLRWLSQRAVTGVDGVG